MYRDFVDILKCPICGNDFELVVDKEDIEILEGKIVCSEGHEFNIVEGVVNFNSKEQEGFNNWSEMEKEFGFDEMNRRIKESTPANELMAIDKGNEYILNHITSKRYKKIIDIASGRGMLARFLAKNIDDNLELICTDLSLAVLIYDRKKILEINPNMLANFVACDASNLPFKDNSFDASVSLFGIQNMMNLMQKGIKESVRVAKNELINSCITIKNDNPKIEEINNFMKENNVDYDFNNSTEGAYKKVHDLENYDLKIDNIFEDIAIKNDNDMVPIEGEPFFLKAYKIIK